MPGKTNGKDKLVSRFALGKGWLRFAAGLDAGVKRSSNPKRNYGGGCRDKHGREADFSAALLAMRL